MERAALKKYRGADARPIMCGKALDVEYKTSKGLHDWNYKRIGRKLGEFFHRSSCQHGLEFLAGKIPPSNG